MVTHSELFSRPIVKSSYSLFCLVTTNEKRYDLLEFNATLEIH